MKNRIISGTLALLILVPIIIQGGIIFNICAYIIGLLGLKELLDARSKQKELPFPVTLIAYIFMTLLILIDVSSSSIIYSLDYRIIASLFLTTLFLVVLYHNKEKYSVVDAFYMIGSILFLGISMALIIMLRAYSLKIFIFLILITLTTDIFSYITNYLVGKHKILRNISPNQSWEGIIVGTVMGVFVSSMFYYTCINPSVNIFLLLLICTFLSLLGQIGDLSFNSIKKYFKIDKFSNIMPGHGGVLDRLDSIIFVLLGFTFFITLL